MAEVSLECAEALQLLHSELASRLVAHLSEQRLRQRRHKSKTVQRGRGAYGQLLATLSEAGYFRQLCSDDARLTEMMVERDVIEDAIAPLVEGLRLPVHLGADVFFLIIGWISGRFKLSDVDLYDIVTCYSLAPTEEGRFALLLRNIVRMVIDNAVLRLQAERCSDRLDRDLLFLLQNGTASGIYGRLRTLVHCGALLYEGNSDSIIVDTIATELPRLSRSRQIVLTRVLRHITENILGCANRNARNPSQRQSAHLWRLIVKGIDESGVPELAYDDPELLRVIRNLGREFDFLGLAAVLTRNTRSYVNDLSDFRRKCDLAGAFSAMRKHGIVCDFPETFNLSQDNIGTVLLNKHLF
ncbi:deoxycytidine triphosphate deaminase [Babesia caballi]|uniref:Deoxycytidine triphosphate deaminase n=1 Tax=Babesia caballi TaxID=5871 RepID=A0AAV4LM77_BABCB|nr:deoxycytidine triphosphate deaminase [Babesia caballi]